MNVQWYWNMFLKQTEGEKKLHLNCGFGSANWQPTCHQEDAAIPQPGKGKEERRGEGDILMTNRGSSYWSKLRGRETKDVEKLNKEQRKVGFLK